MRRAPTAGPTPPPAAQYRSWDSAWKPGDPKPVILATSPAVAQALGRCLAWRVQKRLRLGLRDMTLHPRECSWCAYRDEEIEAAVGYACFVARYDLVSGEYANDDWARFFAGLTPATRDLPPDAWQKAAARRHAAIEEAQYGGLPE